MPEIGNLETEVSKADAWCLEAKKLIASLALTDIDQIEPLVSASFKAQPTESVASDEEGPMTKRARTEVAEGMGYSARLQLRGKEVQGLKNYESSLSDLTATLANVKVHIVPLLESGKLPTQTQLEALKNSLGMVRDSNLEDDITQLHDGATKWSDRADSVMAVPFPRPAGVLRSLSTLIHDLASSPMQYSHWREVVQIASEEVWAHGLRYISLPLGEARLDHLIATCPFTDADAMDASSGDGINDLSTARRVESEIAAVLLEKQDDWMRQVLGLAARDGAAGLVPDEITLLRRCREIHAVYVKSCGELLTPRRVPMHIRAEAETFLEQLQSSALLAIPSLVVKVQLALNRNSAFESASTHLASRLEADYTRARQGLPSEEKDLFHDLLALLESVEFAELRVEHFDNYFTPLVGKLLQYQSTVRALFKWDHDETVSEIGYRPSLDELESVWKRISSEADSLHKLSESFISDVAYIASAFKALTEARDWRSGLAEIVGSLRGQGGEGAERMTIAGLKKHVGRWPSVPVQVPFADIITNAEMAEIDEWSKTVAGTVNARSKSRKRASLEEARALLAAAPRPLCVNSVDYDTLASQVAAAEELRQLSSALILQSFDERIKLTEPSVTNEAAPLAEVDMIGMELTRLLRESRRSPVQVGTENLVETEIRIRSTNRNLIRILTRPHAVPLDTVEPFVDSIATPGGAEEDAEMEDAGEEMQLPGVTFSATPCLVAAVRAKVNETHKWKHTAADFLALLPVHHSQTSATVPTTRKSSAANSGGSTPQGDQAIALSTFEAALGSSLNAPPTVAGEKFLDIVLRNLDREPVRDVVKEGVHSDYVFSLPLYQLPSTAPSSANGGAPIALTQAEVAEAKRGRKAGGSASRSKAASNQPAGAVPENPLLIKGLSPMHQLLYQVPWTRPGLGYLSPLNEVLLTKPREFLDAEKTKLRERISRPNPTLRAALEVLLEHRRASLFQTSEYLRIRSFSALSLKTVKNCLTRFPFLVPTPATDITADIPMETWERFVHPSTASGPSGSPLAAEEPAEEAELVGFLLQLEALAFQVPTKYRLLMLMLDMYDWRVRAQSVCHHMHRDSRPRPWAGDERALAHWATVSQPADLFAAVPIASSPPPGDPLCLHVIPAPPPQDFILCAMHMSFYYVIESSRHFIRVMSDMCELCYGVTTTDQEDKFWISCDACDKWFHGTCAGLTQAVAAFTCPNCLLASSSVSVDRKRMAQSLLQSLPPRRHNPVAPAARLADAENLLAEARQQQIVMALGPSEVNIFKRLAPTTDFMMPLQ